MQGCWPCSPPSPGKALAEVCVGLVGAGDCSLPPPCLFFVLRLAGEPEVDGAGPFAGRRRVKSCRCWSRLVCRSLWKLKRRKLERSVPKQSGRGAALALCRGPSRRAPPGTTRCRWCCSNAGGDGKGCCRAPIAQLIAFFKSLSLPRLGW